jgi:hypothetical protein
LEEVCGARGRAGHRMKARIFSFVFARVAVVMGVGRMATLFTPCGWELGRE